MSEGTLSYLKGEVERLRKENAAARVKRKEAQTENNRLSASLAEATSRLTDLESRQGKPSDLQERIGELTAELRDLKHKGSFRKLAIDAGVNPEAIDDAWAILKLRADTDEPDEAALQAALAAAKESKAWLFRPAETPEPDPKPIAPPLGGDRGKPPLHPSKLRVTKAQMADPRFALPNAKAIQAHSAAGTLEIV